MIVRRGSVNPPLQFDESLARAVNKWARKGKVMSSILLNKNGVPSSGAVMVKIECEVKDFSDAINLQLAVERRSKSVTLLEVTPMKGVAKKSKAGRPKGMLDSKPRKKRKRKASAYKHQSASSNTKKDSRAVWDERRYKKVLNTGSTLKNIGLSEKQLMSMPTRLGTLEHSLKCTIRMNKYWAKAARK